MDGIERSTSVQKQHVADELHQLEKKKGAETKVLRLEDGQFKLGAKSKKTVWGWKVARVIGQVIRPLGKVAANHLSTIADQQKEQEAGAVKKLRSVRALTTDEMKTGSRLSLKTAVLAVDRSKFEVVPEGSRVKAPYQDTDSHYQKEWRASSKPSSEQMKLTEEYEYKLESNPEAINKKLDNALNSAKKQQNEEIGKKLRQADQGLTKVEVDYSKFDGDREDGIRTINIKHYPEDSVTKEFKLHYETLGGDAESAVCHAQGRNNKMEDRHISSSFLITVGEKEISVDVTGILDGHGGEGAAIQAKDILAEHIQKRLEEFCKDGVTDLAVWNALKIAFVDASHSITHTEKDKDSGTTANIAIKIGNDLWVANSGDSRAILLGKDGGVTQLSTDAKPKDEKYKESVEKRGGTVSEKGRVNGFTAVARSLGEHVHLGAISARPNITKVKIEPGQTLIQVCDGLPDVGTTGEIGQLVHKGLQNGDTPAMAATRAVESALHGYSFDNLSAMVTRY